MHEFDDCCEMTDPVVREFSGYSFETFKPFEEMPPTSK